MALRGSCTLKCLNRCVCSHAALDNEHRCAVGFGVLRHSTGFVSVFSRFALPTGHMVVGVGRIEVKMVVGRLQGYCTNINVLQSI